jgi:hypothetical protein
MDATNFVKNTWKKNLAKNKFFISTYNHKIIFCSLKQNEFFTTNSENYTAYVNVSMEQK